MNKCINCDYKGDEIVAKMFCPVCGDYIEGKQPVLSKEVLDAIEKKEIEEMILNDKKDVDINKSKENIDSRLDLDNDNISEEEAKIVEKIIDTKNKQKSSRKK